MYVYVSVCVCVCMCTYVRKHPIFINIQTVIFTFPFILRRCGPNRVMASSFLRFLDHTELLWTSDQLVAETQHLQETNIHARRQDSNPQSQHSKRAEADPHLRPRGHRDRRNFHLRAVFSLFFFSHQPFFNLPLDSDVNYIIFSQPCRYNCFCSSYN